MPGARRPEVPAAVATVVGRYLEHVDAGLPGRVEGLYLVGSTALDAYQPGRSDIDFVAVVGDELDPAELARLDRIQRRLYAGDLARSLRPSTWPLTANGVFVRWDDFAVVPTEITPQAQHVSGRFAAGKGFDVNPVQWHTLVARGIAVRGPVPDALGIVLDDDALRAWTHANLNDYWRRWALNVRQPGLAQARASVRHMAAAWGALGVPRLHHTIATGEIISKTDAGEWARLHFDERWHPLIDRALAYWRGTDGKSPYGLVRREAVETAAFVSAVITDANQRWDSR